MFTLFFFSVGPPIICADNPDFSCDARRIKISESLIWETAVHVLDSLSAVVQQTKIEPCTQDEKRKKRKNFWKSLVKTVVALAAKIATQELISSLGNMRSDEPPREAYCTLELVEVCQGLYEILQQEQQELPHEQHVPCLHCIFAIEDTSERAQAISNRLMAPPRQVNLFLQELFSTLFYYCSTKLTEVHTSFYNRVVTKFRRIASETHEIRGLHDAVSISDKQCLASADDETCFICYSAATSILEQTATKSSFGSTRMSASAIISILQIMSSVGDIVFGGNQGEGDKAAFIKKTLLLVKKLYNYLSDEGLIQALKKLSSFLEELDAASSQEEWQLLGTNFLGSVDKGLLFLEETFSHLNIYLHEALSNVFSHMFRQVSHNIYE